jgi:hypothetical protein
MQAISTAWCTLTRPVLSRSMKARIRRLSAASFGAPQPPSLLLLLIPLLLLLLLLSLTLPVLLCRMRSTRRGERPGAMDPEET